MARPSSHLAEESLVRKRLRTFLLSQSSTTNELKGAISRIASKRWDAVIFGGVLRDLTILGPAEVPRDIDVVANVSREELETLFSDLAYSRTRFGGLKLKLKDWRVDIWTLEDTWALRGKPSAALNFESLVHTTFLNVEAIAVDISPRRGHREKIYSAGFFETITNRVLDISFEPNPYPQLCVVRSIVTALKLNWVVSRRLATYVAREAASTSMDTLIDIQKSHYGEVKVPAAKMRFHLESIERALLSSTCGTVRLDP